MKERSKELFYYKPAVTAPPRLARQVTDLSGKEGVGNYSHGEGLKAPVSGGEERACRFTSLCVRQPKDRIEQIALDEKLSMNAWAVRCLERCAAPDNVGDHLSNLLSTNLALASAGSHDAYSPAIIMQIIKHMADQAEKTAILIGWTGRYLDDLPTKAVGDKEYKTWAYDGPGREESA